MWAQTLLQLETHRVQAASSSKIGHRLGPSPNGVANHWAALSAVPHRQTPTLLRQGQRVDASIRVEGRPDRTHHRRLAAQPGELTDPE